MSRAYKFHNTDGLYFVTFATVGWIDVFSQVVAAKPARQTCESGDKDFSSREELINACTSTPNLVSLLAKKTGAAVTGFIGQTSYQPCRSIAMPRGATTGGNHSPSVNNGEVQSVEVTCTNETCTTE